MCNFDRSVGGSYKKYVLGGSFWIAGSAAPNEPLKRDCADSLSLQASTKPSKMLQFGIQQEVKPPLIWTTKCEFLAGAAGTDRRRAPINKGG
jgi:hypothetical protein